MKRKLAILGLILTLVALPLVACAAPAPAPAPTPAPEAEVFKWRMQTFDVAGTEDYDIVLRALDVLKTMTNGRLDITLYPVKTFVGYSEMLEALGAGTYEVGHNACGFFSGLDPGFAPLFTIPGVWEDARQMGIWFDHFGGNELYVKAYAEYNVHYVGLVLSPPEPIMSNRPLRTLDDFAGLKIRTPPGLTTEIFTKLGMAPVALSGSEIYTALDTGVIDAAEFISVKTNWDLGLHEVTTSILFPSFHCRTTSDHIAVNMDAWNTLPDDLKAAMLAFTALLNQRLEWGLTALSWEALELMKDYGLEHTQLSAEDMATVKAMGVETAEEWKAKSALSNEVITSVFDYMRVIGKM